MKRMAIEQEEWWPVYLLEEPTDDTLDPIVDIPEDLLSRYHAALREWQEVQADIEQRLNRRQVD